MAKISRQLLKLFGGSGSSDNFGQFGSKVAGSPLTTKDVPTIQALSAWANGLQDAVVTANKAPYIQDQNSLFYVLCYQLASILQDGIPTWDVTTSYYIGSMVHKDGTAELYLSLTNDNVGNALPTKTNNGFWEYLRFGPPTGAVMGFAQMTDPLSGGIDVPYGYLRCNGQAVSRTTYADLYAVLGTTWGVGNGTTTFNLPDLLERTIVGDDGTPGFVLGTYGGSLTHIHAQIAHDHTVPDHNHVLVNTGPDQSPITSFAKNAQGNTGGQIGIDPTFSGVGVGPKLVSGTASTVSGIVTGNAQPPIQAGSSLQPYGVMQWMIKT